MVSEAVLFSKTLPHVGKEERRDSERAAGCGHSRGAAAVGVRSVSLLIKLLLAA
jgi:hypothetical protein